MRLPHDDQQRGHHFGFHPDTLAQRPYLVNPLGNDPRSAGFEPIQTC
jgi:hypothetical protein